jgi:hypothetical protein
MTINSVTLANGTALKFNYDGKKEDDNLEIMLIAYVTMFEAQFKTALGK